jgi:hypothetical protein
VAWILLESIEGELARLYALAARHHDMVALVPGSRTRLRAGRDHTGSALDLW